MRELNTALLLRQKVPPDKGRITFVNLNEVDDMWIQLFYQIHRKLDIKSSEVWMWGGGPRYIEYEKCFVEKWFPEYPVDKQFDFIFSRGGFPQYLPILKVNPQALKLYYGAIYKDRFNPRAIGDYTNYDIVLADSQVQFEQLIESGYNAHKFIKPACENIFKPFDQEKTFDVLFVANATQKDTKGHEWFFREMKGTGLRILQIGNLDRGVLALASSLGLNIEFTGQLSRSLLPLLACRAKVGICCSTGDSCPRIIPEMLAMGIPIVVKKSDRLFLWDDYFADPCSVLVEEKDFVEALVNHVNNFESFNARKFYLDNFTLEESSNRLVEVLMDFV